ncbi:hypothetical protein TNCV_2247041, partial [Trichonephila clavipes]
MGTSDDRASGQTVQSSSRNKLGLARHLRLDEGQFINQHGHVGRLNQVNLARLYRSTAK